jgi:hypothetical protein
VIRRRRVGLRWGLLLAAVYLVAGLLTLRISGRHVRPLFDGFTGNLPYQWVCPPPDRKADNTAAQGVRAPVGLDASGSQAASPNTPDGQALFSLVAGEFPPHPPDTSLQATIAPLCASQLGPPPAGYSAAGNAYRFSVTYQPSGMPVGPSTKPGNTVIKPPTVADVVLYSTDNGRTWQLLESFVSGQSVVASFTDPGVYLAARKGGSGTAAAGASKGSSSSGTLIAVGAGVAVVGGAGAVVLVRRRRRRGR